jgi:hypothetical protein
MLMQPKGQQPLAFPATVGTVYGGIKRKTNGSIELFSIRVVYAYVMHQLALAELIESVFAVVEDLTLMSWLRDKTLDSSIRDRAGHNFCFAAGARYVLSRLRWDRK